MTEITRVLHVFGRMQRGGAELRTIEVMKRLRTEGFLCDVLALSGLTGELDAEIEALGGRVYHLPCSLGWRRKLRMLLRQEKYSVLHSHVHMFSGVLLREAHHCGVPIRIAHFRNTGDGKGDGLFRRIYRWVMASLIDRYSTKILAVSHSAMSQAWGKPNDSRCQVVYNGLETGIFFRDLDIPVLKASIGLSSSREKIIMHVGNIIPAKNHAFILRVFEELYKRDKSLCLVLVGRGGTLEEQQARVFIERSNLVDQVKLLGARNDVPDLLRCADAFLFPSLREGLPGALLEACAAGLPCVVSDIAPCREIAERIPGVDCVELNQPVAVWAEHVQQCLVGGRVLGSQVGSKQVVQGGFDLTTATEAIRSAWTLPIGTPQGEQ